MERLNDRLVVKRRDGGTFFQGYDFLPGVATADDVVRSLAVCAGDFYNEDDRTRGK